MARILAVGDLHYGALSSVFSNWHSLTSKVINNVIAYAKEKDIKHIVFTGDIFNVANPPQEVQAKFIQTFIKYPDITFHFYMGNHDYQSDSSNALMVMDCLNKYKVLKNIKVYIQPQLKVIEGRNICFLPWPHTKAHKDAKLVFAHVPVKGSVTDTGRPFKDAFKLESKVTWVIGDLHKYQKENNWIFPGALFQLKSIDDPVRYMLDITIKERVSIETIEVHLPYQIKTLKITKQLNSFAFLDEKNTKWQIYADYNINVPDHKNILRRLPLSDKTKISDNIINENTVLEPTDFMEHLTKWLVEQGLNKKELKEHKTLFMEAVKSVRQR
jgi:DNA repair exonuclease SbcCD nuclease subunit